MTISTTAETLVTLADPRSPAAEAYATLRTNIQFSSLDRQVKSLLVTSTGPAEGKSTTIANLGVTFALAGTSVILVDADLRRPSLAAIFGVANGQGLTNLLLGDAEPASVLQATRVERLRVLTSGPLPPNPSELISSPRFDRVVAALTELADLILFDSPPIIAVTDAAVLARKVDATLLVVSAGKTRRDQAARANQLLERVNAKIIGVVLNNAKVEAGYAQYYG